MPEEISPDGAPRIHYFRVISEPGNLGLRVASFGETRHVDHVSLTYRSWYVSLYLRLSWGICRQFIILQSVLHFNTQSWDSGGVLSLSFSLLNTKQSNSPQLWSKLRGFNTGKWWQQLNLQKKIEMNCWSALTHNRRRGQSSSPWLRPASAPGVPQRSEQSDRCPQAGPGTWGCWWCPRSPLRSSSARWRPRWSTLKINRLYSLSLFVK